MRQRYLFLLVAIALTSPAADAARFSYHGEMLDGDRAANGRYDLRVRSHADERGDKTLGEATELPAVEVRDGRFSVQLDVPEDADGTSWIDVAVRKSGSSDDFETLGARQAVVQGSATCPGAWALDGNAGVTPQFFLGTVDAAPLLLKVDSEQVARFGIVSNAPTVSLGATSNQASGIGASVLGGHSNTASGIFSAIMGGTENVASGQFATVTGFRSDATGNHSTVGGGQDNTASGMHSAVSGGQTNVAAGTQSTVVGGFSNIASGTGSTVGGGTGNCAGGDNSWAGGRSASVRAGNGATDVACPSVPSSGDADGDEGSFVWNDGAAFAGFRSSGPGQFLVRATGGVGINTATFGAAADLRLTELVIKNPNDGGNVDMTLLNRTNRGYGLAVVPGAAGAAGEFYISETDARTGTVGFSNRFRIDAAGTTFVQGGAVGNLSDARLKKNVGEIDSPLDTLLSLHGQVFEYIDPATSMNPPGLRMGFIAQEVQKAIPQWVAPTGADGYLAVTPIGFEALAVEAIRDLKIQTELRLEGVERDSMRLAAMPRHDEQRLQRLEQQNATLQAQLARALQRIERLEASSSR